MNPIEQIPEHLQEYITQQDPSLYTFIDHASWRYIMRVSKVFFAKHGHPLYLEGLKATGIATERVPLVSEMDTALKKFGWRAVAINGFIPPSVFLEMQSLRILAIACDIRTLEHLGYTPSPDIVHEAAGHAPIVADPEYRKYLEAYGEAARHAVISKYDLELYEAIFTLSQLKEDPHSKPIQIQQAQKNFETIAAQEKIPSEAALLTRMAWWTTEYGLVGPIDKPLVYGAGLLSSVDESYACLQPSVKKIPFSLQATIDTSYDITRPQPQLFVAKDFSELTVALNQFADLMAFRRGGVDALKIGQQAENTVTVVLDNGLQFTGVLDSFGTQNNETEETYFVLTGQKQVSMDSIFIEEFPRHDIGNKLFVPLFDKNISRSSLTDIQRKLHGSGLLTKGGLRIMGRYKKEILVNGFVRILLLEQTKIVNQNDEVVFQEKDRVFPLTLASQVTSVFGGAADRKEFALRHGNLQKKVLSHKTNLTAENSDLNDLYQAVRAFRESNKKDLTELEPIIAKLNEAYPKDWLLRLELLELYQKLSPTSMLTAHLKDALVLLKKEKGLTHLIQRGLEL